MDQGSWSFLADKSPFFLHVRVEPEPEPGLKSVCLFVFIALTNLFI